MKYKLRANEV